MSSIASFNAFITSADCGAGSAADDTYIMRHFCLVYNVAITVAHHVSSASAVFVRFLTEAVTSSGTGGAEVWPLT